MKIKEPSNFRKYFLYPLIVVVIGGLIVLFVQESIRNSSQKEQISKTTEIPVTNKEAKTKQVYDNAEKTLKEKNIPDSGISKKNTAKNSKREEEEEVKKTLSEIDEVKHHKKSSTKELKSKKRSAEKDKICFPLVLSVQNKNSAIDFANYIIKSGKNKYPVEVYYSGNDWYTVSLGGFLDKDEAYRRVIYAKEEKIALDAYVWTSTYMFEIDLEFTNEYWKRKYFKPVKKDTWNVIVKSLGRDYDNAKLIVDKLKGQYPNFHFRLTSTVAKDARSNPMYAIYFGNGLTKDEAQEVVKIAKKYSIAEDAYAVIQHWDTGAEYQ